MNREMTERLRATIPDTVIKQIRGRDYISGHTAIDRLIQATDNDWSFRITNVISTPGHVAMQGELTIAGNTRAAWGEAQSTNNPTEELYKNAETDTLKRCARLFGVALELYGELIDEESGEITSRPSTARRGPQPEPARQRLDRQSIERTEIIRDLKALQDVRILHQYKQRIVDAGLRDDVDVTAVYAAAYSRLHGQPSPTPENQPALA